MTRITVNPGDRFGRLTVVKEILGGRAQLECLCDCGTQKKFSKHKVTTGHTRSCGCLKKDLAAVAAAERFSTHGHTRGHNLSGAFRSWSAMISRCHCDCKDSNYANYGAKGITVCDRWRNSFEAFLEDMGEPPTRQHSIDRIDNNCGYSKDNCRWATPIEQAANRRTTRWITFQGETLCVREWERRLGFRPTTISRRFKCGWSIEKALTTPLMRENRRIKKDSAKQ